jgi:replicative DNA helicase
MSSKDEMLSGAMQENVLTVLCFHDDVAKAIRPALDASLFESRVYQDIAAQAMTFLDQYGTCVGDHLYDVFEGVLEGEDTRKATLYKRTFSALAATKDGVNLQYVQEQLHKFIHLQGFKKAILEAVEKLEAGRVDEAEVVMEEGLRKRSVSFDQGTRLTDTSKSLGFLNRTDEGFATGIEALDAAGIMPARKTMFLFIAAAKKGKSWFITHVGKFGLLQRLKVLVITLEMSEELYAQRFMQSLFSVSKREAQVMLPRMRRTDVGHFMGVDFANVTRPSLTDSGIRRHLEQSIADKLTNKPPLIIKAFPTSSLTIAQYKAYLDSLERIHNFVPDMVLLDYPDLMDVATEDLRTGLSRLFKQLRGVAVERNHALVVPTQGNRDSASARTTADTHVSEDYSKIATADVAVTYSQTPEEKRMGLARLFVANARSDEDKFQVLVTQAYAVGQFALDSTRMQGDYWQVVERGADGVEQPARG